LRRDSANVAHDDTRRQSWPGNYLIRPQIDARCDLCCIRA